MPAFGSTTKSSSKSRSSSLYMIWTPSLRESTSPPVCWHHWELWSLHQEEVAEGRVLTAASAQREALSKTTHFSPPFTTAWMWLLPGGDPLFLSPYQVFPRCSVLPGPKHAGFLSYHCSPSAEHTQHIQGIPEVLGLLHLSKTQPICIYSITVSGKSGCVQPRHNFQARKRVCSETSDIF